MAGVSVDTRIVRAAAAAARSAGYAAATPSCVPRLRSNSPTRQPLLRPHASSVQSTCDIAGGMNVRFASRRGIARCAAPGASNRRRRRERGVRCQGCSGVCTLRPFTLGSSRARATSGPPPARPRERLAGTALSSRSRIVALASASTVTKRGSRRVFCEMQRQMISPDSFHVSLQEPAHATLVASRLEAGQVVEQVRVPFSRGLGRRRPRSSRAASAHAFRRIRRRSGRPRGLLNERRRTFISPRLLGVK